MFALHSLTRPDIRNAVAVPRCSEARSFSHGLGHEQSAERVAQLGLDRTFAGAAGSGLGNRDLQSFNDFVCLHQKRRRNRYSERPRHLEIEDKLESGRLLDRQIRGRFSF